MAWIIFVLNVFFTAVLYQVEGKLLENLGRTWNRPFRVFNLTVEDYVENLAWRVGNVTTEKGLNFTTSNYSFNINGSLLGLTLKGDVSFENGFVTSGGTIVPSVYATEANRSADLATGKLNFAVRLNKLQTLHHLKTVLENNNADGSVETFMKDIDFFFELNHKFASGINTVQPTSLGNLGDTEWSIKPRSIVTYAVEEMMKRDNATTFWYKKDLETWQRDVLAPLVVQEAASLPFPLDPN